MKMYDYLNDSPFSEKSFAKPGKHFPQACPEYPSGHRHCSTDFAGVPLPSFTASWILNSERINGTLCFKKFLSNMYADC